MKPIDLTHTLSDNVPTFAGCGFHLHMLTDYAHCKSDVKFRVQEISLHAGTGTHLDAPAHIQQGKLFIDEIPLHQLYAPLIMIDVAAKADATYRVSRQDILDFERQHGTIPAHSFVVVYTGWDKRWPTLAFRNELKFPSVSIEAAQLLLERNIVGLGIDTLSADLPESGYPVHALLLGNNRLLLECVNHANQMPATGAHILIAPLKIKGATEAPARVFGLI